MATFSHRSTKQAIMDAMARRGKPRPTPTPKTLEELEAERQSVQACIDAWLNSPEFAEECRKDEEKQKRAEQRRLDREAKREAAREERRRNPKSPIDAYYNHMENCPPGWLDPKERRAWKKENPTFEFNGVTYRDHWSPQRSNSGKTTRWMSYLTGSDGSSVLIKDEHINNRRNDPERNWGLPE
jgi:hypothetical protein